MITQKRITKKGNNYWKDSGAYQKEYEELYKKLVPNIGSSDTLNGELVRAISRLMYEYYNNANMNARQYEEVYNSYTDEYYTSEPYIDSFYEKFLNLIESVGIDTSKVKEAILKYDKSPEMFDEDVERSYVDLMDEVMYYVLTHEDKELPYWYEKDRN